MKIVKNGSSFRILKDDGIISIIHWRSDIQTPRGPSLDIRPKPQDCEKWLRREVELDEED